MFRLIAFVKRGSASNLPEVWVAYPTLEAARAAAVILNHHERVARVMIVQADVPPTFVEWA
jgi:hypothetical protein